MCTENWRITWYRKIHIAGGIRSIESGAEKLSFIFSSVAQSCPTLCNPMNCSTPGLPVHHLYLQFSSVQSLSRVQLFVTPWTAAHQASQSNTNSRSPPKLMLIESVMPSNHLILFCSLLLLPSIFPSIRVFSNESALCIRWPKYWSFSISPSNEYSGLISSPGWTGWISLQSKGLSRVFSNTTVQKHQFFGTQLSL